MNIAIFCLSTCCTLVSRSADFLPWKWRRYIPPKHRFAYWLHGAIFYTWHPLSANAALTSPTSGGLSAGIVRSRIFQCTGLIGVESCNILGGLRTTPIYTNYSSLPQATNFSYIKNKQNLGYGFHFQHRNPRPFPIDSLAHDSGRALVRAEYGYPKGSPNTNS
jgi:hypothetical protein